MAWSQYSGHRNDGTAPVVAHIEAMLTAHAAWEFVENVTQIYERFHSTAGVYFPEETYTCRVWKNLGTVNGYGKDFFVAIITMAVQYHDETNFALTGTEDQNAVWFLPFEEWNTTLKRMRKPAGVDFWKYGATGSTDLYLTEGDNYSLHGNQWFNLVEAQLADDGLTWGTWGWWKRNIASVPLNIRNEQSIWDFNWEPYIEWDNAWWGQYYDGTPPDPTWAHVLPDNNPTKVWIRVTNLGILIYSTDWDSAGEDYNGDATAGYVGLGIESHRPPELRSGFPLMHCYMIWLNQGGDESPFTRYPEWGGTVPVDYLQCQQIYDFSFNVGANRTIASYPGTVAWAAMPCKVSLDPVNTEDYYGLVYDPGTVVPGVYFLCGDGAPPFQEGDTITSPEGHDCVLVPYDYSLPNPSPFRFWSIIDKDLT